MRSGKTGFFDVQGRFSVVMTMQVGWMMNIELAETSNHPAWVGFIKGCIHSLIDWVMG